MADGVVILWRWPTQVKFENSEQKEKEQTTTWAECLDWINASASEQMTEFKAAGGRFWRCTLGPHDLIFVPEGIAIVHEVTHSEDVLGLRIGVRLHTNAAHMQEFIDMFVRMGKNAELMQLMLDDALRVAPGGQGMGDHTAAEVAPVAPAAAPEPTTSEQAARDATTSEQPAKDAGPRGATTSADAAAKDAEAKDGTTSDAAAQDATDEKNNEPEEIS